MSIINLRAMTEIELERDYHEIVCVGGNAPLCDSHDPEPVSSDGSITWDEHYDSPKADLILISKVVVGFRVDSYLMAKKWWVCELL